MKEIIDLLHNVVDLHNQMRKESRICKRENQVNYSVVPEDVSELLVIGDLHGDYATLERIIAKFVGSDTFLVFLGDYVDRGRRQLDVLLKVCEMKLQNPERVILLRGNHEDERMNRYYGFYGMVPEEIYAVIRKLFEVLDIFALWPDKFFFVHGGIPRLDTYSLSGICNPALVSEMLWNDPNSMGDEYLPSPRGIGWLFPRYAVEKFCDGIGVKAIIRGHQPRLNCEQARAENLSFSGKLWTVFSTGKSRDSYYQGSPYVVGITKKGYIHCYPIWE